MSIQFDTFDNVADRRELVVLFQRLGEGLPDAQACAVRAKWLEALMADSLTMPNLPVYVDPASCSAVGAYDLFVQIVGVLGVPIRTAAIKLDRAVAKGEWRA